MFITSGDIYPLAQRLHSLIPPDLRRWTGGPDDPVERDQLVNTLLMELTVVPDGRFVMPSWGRWIQFRSLARRIAFQRSIYTLNDECRRANARCPSAHKPY